MLIVFLMLFLSTSIGIKAQHFLVVSVCARVIMAKRGRRTRYAPVRGDDEVFLGKRLLRILDKRRVKKNYKTNSLTSNDKLVEAS